MLPNLPQKVNCVNNNRTEFPKLLVILYCLDE